MRAILRTKFGGPEVLVIREIPEQPAIQRFILSPARRFGPKSFLDFAECLGSNAASKGGCVPPERLATSDLVLATGGGLSLGSGL
jgi:hypothetical protein